MMQYHHWAIQVQQVTLLQINKQISFFTVFITCFKLNINTGHITKLNIIDICNTHCHKAYWFLEIQCTQDGLYSFLLFTKVIKEHKN